MTEAKQRRTFEKWDRDGDGLIKKRQFRRKFKRLDKKQKNPANFTNKEINQAFEALDFNKDGNLDFEEFKRGNIAQRSPNNRT